MNEARPPSPEPPRAPLTEQYREGQRLLESAPIRAAYVLPFATLPLLIGAVVVSRLVPKQYEDVVSNVLGGIIAIVVFGTIGAVIFVSLKSASRSGSVQVPPNAATFQAIASSFASGMKAPALAEVPPAPFDESPEARRARVEQLRAMNGMLRAARANAAPFMSMGKFMIASFPIVMLFVAFVGVATVVQGLVTGHLPPKTSIGDGVVMTALGVGAAIAFHRLVIVPHQVLAKRVAGVARHVQGREIAGSATAMLDWLDQHWPEFVPSSGVAAWGWHWVVPFAFRERQALFSVIDDLGGRGVPRVRRVDLFLACPCAAPLLDEGAVARARALGFEPVQSPAGVRFERRDNAPAAVAPEVVDALLRLVP
jgi:hypothetical protein